MLDFSNLRVLVVGDMSLDIIQKGESYRNAPESDSPVILNPKEEYSLGMAANVAVILKNLGANVNISTFLGYKNSSSTNKAMELFIKNNIDMELRTVGSHENADTTIKKRIFANDKQVARLDFENFKGKDRLWLGELERNYDVYEEDYFDFIVISDYDKGFINKDSWKFIKPVLDKCNKSGIYFVDTKKKNVLDFYEGMYIFPNTKEMNEILKHYDLTTRNNLRVEMDLDFIVETASHEGAFIYKNDGKIIRCKSFEENQEPKTVYGAGDVFIAAFSLHYMQYNNKIGALEFANYCCSKAIMKDDRCNITLKEVIDFA